MLTGTRDIITHDGHPFFMRPVVSWMTKSDIPILELLAESGLELPPAAIAHNIEGISYSTIKRRLSILEKENMIIKTKEKQGYYGISERGQRYLEGELEREDLERL